MDLKPDTELALHSDVAHYLGNVMRMKRGFQVRLFNEKCGEYVCELTAVANRKKGDTRVYVKDLIRPPCERNDIFSAVLYCAPIKKPRMKVLLEKVTELGVGHIVPVVTQNTNTPWDTDSAETYNKLLIESSEQSERLSLPVLHKPIALSTLLETWPDLETNRETNTETNMPRTHPLMVCRERLEGGSTISDAVARMSTYKHDSQAGLDEHGMIKLPGGALGRYGLFIGPEGGFTADETTQMVESSSVAFVSLANTVLRAETAAIVAVGAVAAAEPQG
jgi:16S rRNA (uracil1498-N3)-methyltransferase